MYLKICVGLFERTRDLNEGTILVQFVFLVFDRIPAVDCYRTRFRSVLLCPFLQVWRPVSAVNRGECVNGKPGKLNRVPTPKCRMKFVKNEIER